MYVNLNAIALVPAIWSESAKKILWLCMLLWVIPAHTQIIVSSNMYTFKLDRNRPFCCLIFTNAKVRKHLKALERCLLSSDHWSDNIHQCLIECLLRRLPTNTASVILWVRTQAWYICNRVARRAARPPNGSALEWQIDCIWLIPRRIESVLCSGGA